MSVNVKQNGALVRVAGLYESAIPIGLAEKYSTEERQVGVSTDGKPIYKKSYITTTAVTLGTSWSSVVFTVANVEKPIKAELIRYTGSAYTTYLIGCNNDNGFKFVTFTGNINCQAGSIFTVWYTKTTDTPGSGIYASDEATLAMLGDVNINTPTDGQVIKYDFANQKWVNGDASGGVNYSTTERKVGTWIDGSDIYEITYLIEKSDLVSQGSNNYNYIWSIPFDRVVDLRPIIKYNVNYTTIPSGTTNSNYQNYISQLTNNNIQFTFGANIWSQLNDIKITLLYTKATS